MRGPYESIVSKLMYWAWGLWNYSIQTSYAELGVYEIIVSKLDVLSVGSMKSDILNLREKDRFPQLQGSTNSITGVHQLHYRGSPTPLQGSTNSITGVQPTPLQGYINSITGLHQLHYRGTSTPLQWFINSITEVHQLHYRGPLTPLQEFINYITGTPSVLFQDSLNFITRTP